jgi:protein-tyrosine phosphatase
VIDLHSHILPGIDDGAQTLDDSLAIARAAVADGIEILAATPHVRADYPTRAETMEAALAELRDAIAGAGIPLDVRGGAEIALDRLEGLDDPELGRLGLAGSPGYLLLEFPYTGWPLALPGIVIGLRSRGVTPVIAHPERNQSVQADPERLRPVVLAGALVQLTAASLDGRIGSRSREAGFILLDRGLAHLVASDAHMPDLRGIGMSEAGAAVGDPALASWLTREVPAAIVAGEPPPPRPSAAAPRRARRFLRLVGN